MDAADRGRLGESRVELDALLGDDGLGTTTTPVLILGNKIDVPGAASEDELRQALGLLHVRDARPVALFMCSVVRRQGYKEGFQWLAQFV